MRSPREHVIVKRKRSEAHWPVGREAGEGDKGGTFRSRRKNKRVMWKPK